MVIANKKQHFAFVILFIEIVAITAILNYSYLSSFQRFIGEINPLIAILLSGIAGFFLLSYLLSKNWFSIYKKEKLKKSFRLYLLAVLFATVAIFVDWNIVYPKNMNIPFPESLLFYPAIGFFVEILFHIIPLSLLLISLKYFFKDSSHNKLIWISISIVALLEPTYQAIFMGDNPMWAIVIIWINLYLFNLTQLFIFKKHDFISMYLFRFFYYIIWHIAWGHFRLGLLF